MPEQSQSTPIPALGRVEEVARHLAVSRGTIYALIRAGELASVRVGRRGGGVRVPWNSVERFIQRGGLER